MSSAAPDATKKWMRNDSAKVPYVAVQVVGEADAEGKVLVKDEAGTETRTNSDGLYSMNLDQQPDCSLLFHLSEAALLANLLTRDALTLPYTTTGNVLTSINPCKPLPDLYSVGTMKQYVDRRPGACPPHLYAVAEQAYRNLCNTAGSQAIVVSGVSGAGKTEANKHIMQYLCWRAGQKPESMKSPRMGVSAELLDVQLSTVSRCVLQSSVVFEAFCNACTTNNHNSSRFGKFVRLLVEPNGPVAGAAIDAYLLEKSRLVAQCDGERSFHVFYQLISDRKLCTELNLLGAAPADPPADGSRRGSALLSQRASAADGSRRGSAMTPRDQHPAMAFNYLRHSGRTTIDGVDDAEEWRATLAAQHQLGISAEERQQIAELLAGLLRLGNVGFCSAADDAENHKEGSELDGGASKAELAEVARLWQLNKHTLSRGLTERGMTTRRGSNYAIPLNPAVAAFGRDALAKMVYERLFRWLLATQNEKLAPTEGEAPASFLGLLDAFGFELLQSNSFEQLLINTTNEQLQQLFLQRVLKAEQQLYEAEGITLNTTLEFTDNAPTLAVLLGKPKGLLALLDEECRLPNGTDKKYAEHAAKSLQAAGHEQSHVTPAGLVQIIAGTGKRQEETKAKIKQLFSSGVPHFTVSHFAGEVVYEAAGWRERNNDELHRDLLTLLGDTDHELLGQLFEPAEASTSFETGTVKTPTIAQVFALDLEGLMGELNASHVHFVRCIKPNDALTPGAPDAGLVLDQLRFSGMLEAVALISSGYPGRIPFVEIHERFQGKLPDDIMRMSPGDFVRALIDAIGIKSGAYQIGKSRLFFRTGGADFLRDLQYASGDEVLKIIKRPLLEWWARAKIGGGVLGWRGRREARGERKRHIEAMRRKAELRKEAEAALRAAMAPEQHLLDLAALAAAIEKARGADVSAALIDEAQELLDTVEALRRECTEALHAAMKRSDSSTRLDLEALRAALDDARAAGVDAELLAAGASLLSEEEARRAKEEAERAAKAAAEEERRRKMAAEERARLEAAERAAATRVQAAQRGRTKRQRYGAMRKATLRLQAAARRYAVCALTNDVLLDLRLLCNGHVFIKFSQGDGRPHDRLVQLQMEGGPALKWSDPAGGPAEGGGIVGIPLAELKSVSGSLNFGLLKKIIDSVRGFDGEKSGISGHFALRTKCCFTMNGQKRSLDVQAPSEAIKEDWVSAIKLMVAYFKLGSLSTPAERAKLEEALESRRFVREALKNKKKKRKEKKQSIFMSFAPKRFTKQGDDLKLDKVEERAMSKVEE